MKYSKVAGFEHDFLRAANDADTLSNIRTFERYVEAKNKGEILNIKFVGVNSVSNELYVESDGVRISADISELERISGVKKLSSVRLTQDVYAVKVDYVDEASRSVHCTFVNLRESAKSAYRAAIEAALVNNEEFCVRTRVVHVDIDARRVFVDIAGVGLQGVIPLGEWSRTYISSFKNIVSVGDIIPVIVLRQTQIMKHQGYVCSRKRAIDVDSWSGIEQRYPVGSVVAIRCVMKKTPVFFGNIEGLRDIEVMCEYHQEDSKGNPLIIEEGCRYMGIIYRCSEARRKLKARILYKINER